jgi:phosphatidylethanolamine-binding protein (PEBP) family uncharacterized protein
MGDVVKETIAAVDSGSTPTLGVTFPDNKPISKPGIHLPRADAASTPTISYSAPSSTGKYLAVCIDIDAPFPSFAILGPALHWIQPGLVPSSSGELTVEGDAKPIAAYAGPRPPPISSAHRYAFLLYEQPADFDGAKLGLPEELGIKDRMRWNQAQFEKKAGLGKVVAGNWFKSK